jgi:hypothetical protein
LAHLRNNPVPHSFVGYAGEKRCSKLPADSGFPYHSKEIVMKMTQNTRWCLTAMLALSAVLYRIVFRANQQAGD